VPGGVAGAHLGSKVFDLVPWLFCFVAASFFFPSSFVALCFALGFASQTVGYGSEL
jgi:hypothetical protein